jgi:propanediol dehydratase small subunit
VPDELLLAVYTALRPRRATAEELEGWAARLEEHGANRTAAFVREAAEAYMERGLLAHA